MSLSYKSSISKEEIDLLPQKGFEGEMVLIDNPNLLAMAEEELLQEKILGFDTESKPTFRKGQYHHVAMLQLSTKTKAYLIRTLEVGLSDKICGILSSPDVLKIGVALRDDIKDLKKLKNFAPNGFVDLQQEVNKFGIEDNGLRKLAANVLGINISKKQQRSNWEASVLSESQLRYAATDAWVCLEIYEQLYS